MSSVFCLIGGGVAAGAGSGAGVGVAAGVATGATLTVVGLARSAAFALRPPSPSSPRTSRPHRPTSARLCRSSPGLRAAASAARFCRLGRAELDALRDAEHALVDFAPDALPLFRRQVLERARPARSVCRISRRIGARSIMRRLAASAASTGAGARAGGRVRFAVPRRRCPVRGRCPRLRSGRPRRSRSHRGRPRRRAGSAAIWPRPPPPACCPPRAAWRRRRRRRCAGGAIRARSAVSARRRRHVPGGGTVRA